MSDNLDRYFDRQDHLAEARTHVCPTCAAPVGQQCTDRWGLLTSLVHQARHFDGYIDPYGMDS